MHKKIFVSFPLNVPGIYKPLLKQGYELILGANPSPPVTSESKDYSEVELIEKFGDIDAVLACPRLPITKRVLISAEKLLCVCQRGIGFDNVDLETASELGILVTNAPVELEFVSAAEHTVALILALAKKLKTVSELLQLEATAYFDERVSTLTLRGKTIGIIGLGRIGTRVANLLRSFDVKLLVYTRTQDLDKAKSLGVELVDLEVLLRESDFVTIHVPLTEHTRHMIGAEELALMKKTAYIINTARGAIINEKALIKALKTGKIAGAALDVLEKEPVNSNNPLLKMDNVIITPHIAGRNAECLIEGEKTAVDNCVKILNGEIPDHLVNPEAVQKWRGKLLT